MLGWNRRLRLAVASSLWRLGLEALLANCEAEAALRFGQRLLRLLDPSQFDAMAEVALLHEQLHKTP